MSDENHKSDEEKAEPETAENPLAGRYNGWRDDDWYREQERERIMEEDKGDHWIWE